MDAEAVIVAFVAVGDCNMETDPVADFPVVLLQPDKRMGMAIQALIANIADLFVLLFIIKMCSSISDHFRSLLFYH
jgi:hypothetical protein